MNVGAALVPMLRSVSMRDGFLAFYRKSAGMGSFVVIRFSLDNRAGTIDLFGEDDTNHLVGEGHSGKRYLTICPGIDGIAETVGTADDKDQLTGYALAVLHPGCELDGAVFLAMLIHQDNRIRRLE